MNSRARISLILAFCTSLGVHGVAYASLAFGHPGRTQAEVSQMDFELPPLPSPAPASEPEPPSPASTPDPPRKAPVARAPAPSRAASAPTAPSNPATTPAPALDLSGVTLTNDSGVGFAMKVGDGSALHGPIGSGSHDVPAGSAQTHAASIPRAPAMVAANDLSEHPKAPALAGLLRQNYPEDARQRGLRGDASLRARIDSDGLIRSARVLSESSSGFGSACRRTVLGSRWSVPRDKNGSAVATEIVYTCHFEVDR